MRIAFVNSHGSCVGGVETYLRSVIPVLDRRGHATALLHQHPLIPERPAIAPAATPRWCISEIGAQRSLDELRRWHPDVLFFHSMIDQDLAASLIEACPSVFFVHGYVGTCISGAKMHSFPEVTPCHRRFGPACLGLFFPRRCGGLNPATMWKEYQNQRRSLALLRQCRVLMTHSDHMRSEYLAHGFADDRVTQVPYPVELPAEVLTASAPAHDQVNLLFLGRFDRMKGGDLLLKALPPLVRKLNRPVELIMAGDGPEAARWKKLARAAVESDSRIHVHFPGWITGDQRSKALAVASLLMIPSVWPEPFGMVGLEAGHFGVPSVAFDVGGIQSWLEHGVNGFLAPADPPSAEGLVAGVTFCLEDPGRYQKLRSGAALAARMRTFAEHVNVLEEVFAKVVPGMAP